MRARQVKPEFFKDKKMGQLGPTVGLVYEALWCMADDGGAVLCTPELVKGEMFMYWAEVTVEQIASALEKLAEAKRIRRYKIADNEDNEYALILRWKKHQPVHNPSQFRHPRPEQPLTRAEADGQEQEVGSTTIGEGQSSHLIDLPSSTPEHPTSHLPDGGRQQAGRNGQTTIDLVFEEIWSAYPKRAGGDSKHDALLAFQARVRAGEDPAAMLGGVVRYAAYCRATDKVGTEFVKQARTFLGRSRHYLEQWDPPARNRASRTRAGVADFDYSSPTNSIEDVKWAK